MIDTERARIDVQNSLSRVRHIYRQMKEKKEAGTISRLERSLLSDLCLYFNTAAKEAQEILCQQQRTQMRKI